MGYKRSRLKISSPTGNTTAARGKDTARDRRLNRRKYAQLLSRTLPRIIENDAELRQVTENVEPLLDKGARRTPEEEALCRLLIRLIEDYQQFHPLIPKLGPKRRCRHCSNRATFAKWTSCRFSTREVACLMPSAGNET